MKKGREVETNTGITWNESSKYESENAQLRSNYESYRVWK